jgi:hypothetical protein
MAVAALLRDTGLASVSWVVITAFSQLSWGYALSTLGAGRPGQNEAGRQVE